MMLGIFLELCEMCNRLLTIVRAQQIELERLETNEHMLEQWKRETDHIEKMFNKLQR